MYEYRTETHYGLNLPDTLIPPAAGFRLRDFRPLMVTESETVNISDRYSSGPGLSVSIPYATGGTRSRSYQWIIVWERYVPEQENE